MISLSKKRIIKISKLSIILFLVYILFFFLISGFEYYKMYNEKVSLTKELDEKREVTNRIKDNIQNIKDKTNLVKSSYASKEEIDNKLKSIFNNFSLVDYNLSLIDTKQMCIDRYILIVDLESTTELGKIAGKKILEYLGEVKQRDEFENIYFVDYIQKPRENR
ncbi:hypothetical protein [Aliarcobacter skirrowii]|jgi:cell division protein FtsX|uniref:Uncharacterized protein n=1 Tax=Aliarcobacter skirrowii CCUG 10374 TaxID=1032239 RepID=A0AAD0SM88_9BACT|nr:hypothetical protein [Aliarcobacter skirrowii]AXX84723.1 hypothetical protein ASKIR_0906 [Aliarcobacter skirrowii CCUG 10374]KAB0620268.1 hypothetical protein F7P70_08445 [Aliarcobacter skirrowii CCUG 10374]RXI25451.1 hypothetical protein CP959_08475 [Aliarcobacter skirrowii CCUG 10374]SUV14896.1 Uncharacterised protein [Aliarcobacter skirrowii]